MQGNLIETLMGAVVLIVAGAFLFFAYSTTEIGTRDGSLLSARFDNSTGLGAGSDVRISGVKVGSVTGNTLDPETYDSVVTFTVDPAYPLPLDSSARIASEGILGGTYLSVSPGADEEFLSPGDEIMFTEGAMDITSLISKFMFSPGEND